ncbi:SymE family type I addiction module toxin [Niabella beijingensis]|uniref:SymE family type I addiction module toxin n=1 Tax=Niabella beijingensis TaxID=2872700 RepID=UPI001CBD116F
MITCLPEIRLLGQWLAACGFAPGNTIQVTTGRNKLIITTNRAAQKPAHQKTTHHEKEKNTKAKTLAAPISRKRG